MKKSMLLSLVAGIFLLSFSNAYSAVFTIEIDDTVPLNKIQSFQFIFEVSSDFSFSNFTYGNAIPSDGMLGWDQELKLSDTMFNVLGGDKDGLYLNNPHDLKTGVLGSFDFEGNILKMQENAIQFLNHRGDNQWGSLQSSGISYTLTQNNLSFSAVPVPSSLLLLGGGLCALFGIRRKNYSV